MKHHPPSKNRFAPADSTQDNSPQGIAWLLAGMALLTVMDAIAKWLSATYPINEIVFFRSFFAFLPITLIVMLTGGRATLPTQRPGLHLLRGVLGLFTVSVFFTAISLMPLADATAVAFASPLFITALSVVLLGEHVGIRRWTAVLIGLIGVAIIIRPGTGVFQPASLLVLIAALSYAFIGILTRRLSQTESTAAILVYTALVQTVLSGLSLPFSWVTPQFEHWPMLVGMGILGGVGQMCIVQAFRSAPASVIAPFEYSTIIWAIALGFLLWQELPDLWTVVGTVILIATGIYILHREVAQRRAS